MNGYRNIRVSPVAGALGAEISGVDVSARLDDDTVAEIRRALLEHLVIFFRGQNLDDASHKAFTRRFGDIFIHPNFNTGTGDPEIVRVVRAPGDERIVGEEWHSDTTMMPEPPMGAILYALEVPPYGGDTLFANQYLAYESLSPGLQKMLDGLEAMHSAKRPYGRQGIYADKNQARSMKIHTGVEAESEIAHPVVRVHAETGRKALYVNVAHTVRFAGMTDDESRPLLRYLFEHSVRPEFTCRFRWRAGSLALWDNRCALHFPINDYHGHLRRMHRITLAGDVPR